MKVVRVQARFLVALVAVFTLVSAKSIAPKSHRMGDIPPAQQQQLELVLVESKPATQATPLNSPATSNSTPEIVIHSVEEPVQANNVRLRYEQPPSQQPNQAAPEGHLEVVASELKMEARSQSDNSLEQSQQQEQLIVDHRPNEGADEQQFVNEYNASNGQPSGQPTPQPGMYQHTSSTPSSVSSPTTATTTNPSTTTSATTASSNATPSAPSPPSGAVPNHWFAASGSSNQPQFYLATQNQMQPANGQANSQFGPMLSASSNQVVSLQHPTSINSIISGEQQQPNSGTNNNNNNNNPAQVLATINGQPTSLIFLGQTPNAATSSLSANLNGPVGQQTQQQPVGIGQNGRRVSISNWLRGIGSLLANIFNRREHGLSQAGLMASSSNGYAFLTPASTSVNSPPQTQSGVSGGGSSSSGSGGSGSGSGNWIQLGPNAPHWLTQAQSAVQQLGASSSRLAASLIQGPGQQQQQQQQGTTTINNFQQVPGDLQMSGSSQSLISVQTPAGVPLTNGGAQPYPGGAAIVLIPPMAQAQQQVQQQVTKQQQIPNAGQVQARSAQARQTGGQQTGDSNPQTSSQVVFGRGQQPMTSATSITSSSSSGGGGSNQITRFNRSATSNPNSLSIGSARNGGNLPLAHYSHYSD